MSAISVRAGRDEDAEEMGAIYIAAARAAWTHIYGASNLENLEPPVKRCRSELRSADARHQVLVAEQDGRVVAFAVIRPSDDEGADSAVVGELDTFYADPSVWGRGIGRELLVAVVEALHQSGFAEATLWTAEANHRPRRIYEAAGWTLDGTTRERTWRGISFRELRYRAHLKRR
jgi:GNAT superfamily N-acetyltransferase